MPSLAHTATNYVLNIVHPLPCADRFDRARQLTHEKLVIIAQLSNDGGFSFFMKGGKLVYGYNYCADRRFRVESTKPIPEGDHIFSFEFTPTGKPNIAKGKGVPANIKLLVDGKSVGYGDLPVTIPLSIGLAAGISVGSDAGSPIMEDQDYKAPFAFTGTVKKAQVDVSGEAVEDKAAMMRMYLARQ